MYFRNYDMMLEIRVQHTVTTRVRPWRRQARLDTRSGTPITNARRATVTTERGQTAGQGRRLHKTQCGLWRHHKLLHIDFSSWSPVIGGEVVGKYLHKDSVPGGAGGLHRMLTRRTKQGGFVRI